MSYQTSASYPDLVALVTRAETRHFKIPSRWEGVNLNLKIYEMTFFF